MRWSRRVAAMAAVVVTLTLATGTVVTGADPSAAPAASAAVTTPAASFPPCTPSKQGLKIGSMIWNTSIPFYSNLIKGEQEQAAKYGMTVDIQSGNGDIATEVALINQFIAQKVDLILVTPSDAQGIVPVIKQANAAGIPVISVNNTVGEGAQVVTFVGANDVQFGQQQGEMLKQALPNGGKVAYILGHLGASAQTLREQGLMDSLKGVTNIQIVDKQTGEWDNAKALALTQDWLSRFPKGQLDAIIDQGPEGATAAKYAHDNGRDEIKFLVGDYPADVKTGITQGYIYGTVDQDPYPQGVAGIDMACYVLSGQQSVVPTPNYYLPLPIVTKENVDQYPAAWGG
jgi:ABC-type sugar transport system substrate-binding protein